MSFRFHVAFWIKLRSVPDVEVFEKGVFVEEAEESFECASMKSFQWCGRDKESARFEHAMNFSDGFVFIGYVFNDVCYDNGVKGGIWEGKLCGCSFCESEVVTSFFEHGAQALYILGGDANKGIHAGDVVASLGEFIGKGSAAASDVEDVEAF